MKQKSVVVRTLFHDINQTRRTNKGEKPLGALALQETILVCNIIGVSWRCFKVSVYQSHYISTEELPWSLKRFLLVKTIPRLYHLWWQQIPTLIISSYWELTENIQLRWSFDEALGASTPTPNSGGPSNTLLLLVLHLAAGGQVCSTGVTRYTHLSHLSNALIDTFYKLVVSKNIKAIDEVGLNYHHTWMKSDEEQKNMIQQQHKLLWVMCQITKGRLPVVIYCWDDWIDLTSLFLHTEYPVYLLHTEYLVYLHCFNQEMDVFSWWL